MNTNFSRFVPIICTLSILTLFAVAVDPLPQVEGPGDAMARMFKLGEKLATPNENHAFLKKFVGSWTTHSSFMKLPFEKGSATHEMILGERFLDGSYEGSFAGVQFSGRMLIGYDNYKHKFVVTFIDSLGTSMRHAEGLLDRTGMALSLWGTMDEWMTDEHDKPVLYRFSFVDEDHFVLEVHDLGIAGGDSLVIEVKYDRTMQ